MILCDFFTRVAFMLSFLNASIYLESAVCFSHICYSLLNFEN